MRVILLAPHAIGDNVYPANTEMELPPGVRPTVLMTPLDFEAVKAVEEEKRRLFPDGVERGMTNPVEPPASFGGPGR